MESILYRVAHCDDVRQGPWMAARPKTVYNALLSDHWNEHHPPLGLDCGIPVPARSLSDWYCACGSWAMLDHWFPRDIRIKLAEHGFTLWTCTAADRFIVRGTWQIAVWLDKATVVTASPRRALCANQPPPHPAERKVRRVPGPDVPGSDPCIVSSSGVYC